MKMKTLRNASFAVAILAAGCALNQVQVPTGLDQLDRAPFPAPLDQAVETKNVKLHSGLRAQGLDSVLNAERFAGQLIREFNGTSGFKTSYATVGSLKARGLFQGTVVSDDSRVIFIMSVGLFTDANHQFGHIGAISKFTQMVAMFDPADGEMLAYGFLP